MIYQLRRRHRVMVTAGALIAPLVLFTALSARPPNVTDSTLQQYRNILPASAVLSGENVVRVGAAAMNVALFETTAATANSAFNARWHLSVSAVNNRQTAGPDILLYWQSNETGQELAADAILLGPLLAKRASVLPLTMDNPNGRLVFFSLAHQRVVETLDLATLRKE